MLPHPGESSSPPCDRRWPSSCCRVAWQATARRRRSRAPLSAGGWWSESRLARDVSPRDQRAASGRLTLLATRRGPRQRCGRSGCAGPACRLAPGKRQPCGRGCDGCLFQPAALEGLIDAADAVAGSPNQQSRSYCRSGDEAGARARRACRQSSDSDEGMADGSVEVPNGSACMGSFDRLRSASSCAAPTERSPGARPRRREPRNGCRDARHDQQRAAL